MKTKVVCIFNNQEIFDKVVKNNENLKDCELFSYDNTLRNTPITQYYNKFIQETVEEPQDEDFWCVFIHQDFGFMENVKAVVEKLNPKYIYGAIGVKILKGIFFGKKGLNKDFGRRLGFKTNLKLILGRILQGNNSTLPIDYNFKPKGIVALFEPTVDSIDCCCIMIHSTLIRKYNLRFDENLKFHMYAEELCFRAKKEHKIKTKIVQTKCFHLGKGNLDEDFQKSTQYLKDKFKIKSVPSICPN